MLPLHMGWLRSKSSSKLLTDGTRIRVPSAIFAQMQTSNEQKIQLTRTYPALPFRVFSHLLYRFAYRYSVPPGTIARTQDELITFLEETVFRLNGDGLRGNISYDGYTVSFMEEGNFYRWNEAETQIGSESEFIFNALTQDIEYLLQENDAA